MRLRLHPYFFTQPNNIIQQLKVKTQMKQLERKVPLKETLIFYHSCLTLKDPIDYLAFPVIKKNWIVVERLVQLNLQE